MEWNEYLDWISEPAKEVCNNYDLPWQCVVAQGAIESAWGNSKIGEYNIFGRKAVEGDKCISEETKEENEDGSWITITADFKDYDSLNEAIDDWCILMTQEPVYTSFSDQYHNDHDLESFVRGIASVYATDQQYGDKIMEIINSCNLV